MSSANIGWLFYKDYFNPKDIDYSDLDSNRNKETIQKKVKNIITQSVTIVEDDDDMLGNTHVKATTTYPGLLLGSGNAHKLPSIEGQVILGFHFDYTTGLPVIQGSSIKGVLRSAFEHPEYIKELVNDEIDVKELEINIFDNGDVFFDATIISNGKILGDDFLTPHKNTKQIKDENGNLIDDSLVNPIPLRFIKVLSGVEFKFDFDLKDGKLARSEKRDLFMAILADLGLGAKTNVGYGKFENFTKIQTSQEQEAERDAREKKSFDDAVSSEELEAFKRNFPKSLHDVDAAIAKIKEQDKAKQVKTSFEKLDKTNKKHVESFIKKYENDPLASDYVARASALFSEKTTKPTDGNIADLSSANDAKQFKSILDSAGAISEADHDIIKENTLRVYTSLKGRRQRNFFKEIQLERFTDKDFQDKMKALVGAK